MRSRLGTGRLPLPILTSITAVLLAVGIGVFFVPAGAGQGHESLVRVDASTPDVWRLLRSLDAKLHFRGPDYAIVRLEMTRYGLWTKRGWPGRSCLTIFDPPCSI
jgi:hypothetical protein